MANVCTVLEPNSDGNLIYYAGDSIRGYVEVSLSSNLILKGIFIVVGGRARTHIKNKNSDVEYNGLQTFINEKTYVYRSSNGSAGELKAGKYKYYFNKALPKNLPYSLNLGHGDISYYVETFLQFPDFNTSKSFVPFKVIRHYDVMLSSELQLPQTMGEDFNCYGCCCYGSPTLDVSITIPRTGYFCGEDIPIDISFVNHKNVHFWDTKLTLIQSVEYYCDTPSDKEKTENMIVASKTIGGVKKHESKILKDSLTIPYNVLGSNKKYCKLIAISYSLKIEIIVEWGFLLSDFEFPITIGPKTTIYGMSTLTSPNFNRNLSRPMGLDALDVDLPPSFLEATNESVPIRTTFGQQFINVGWNL